MGMGRPLYVGCMASWLDGGQRQVAGEWDDGRRRNIYIHHWYLREEGGRLEARRAGARRVRVWLGLGGDGVQDAQRVLLRRDVSLLKGARQWGGGRGQPRARGCLVVKGGPRGVRRGVEPSPWRVCIHDGALSGGGG